MGVKAKMGVNYVTTFFFPSGIHLNHTISFRGFSLFIFPSFPLNLLCYASLLFFVFSPSAKLS